MSMSVDYNSPEICLQPKQAEFLQLVQTSPATTIGVGGAKGGGKSHVGRRAIYMRRFWYPGTNALIFRRTWAEVRDNHLKPLLAENPELKKHYRSQDKTIYLPWVGSEITFGTAEHELDILAYYGRPFSDILVDESQMCTPWMINKLKESNRQADRSKITPKMFLAMNPGGLNHAYHKRVFITREYEENEDPEDFAFLQMYGWDNVQWVLPALDKAGVSIDEYYSWPSQKRFVWFVTKSKYGKKLWQLNEHDRRANLFGDWDVYAGRFFSMFRRQMHVIRQREIPSDWRKLGTIDWGQRAVLEIQACDFRGNNWNFGEVYTEHEATTPRAQQMAEYLLEKKLYRLDIQYDTNMEIDLSEVGYEKVPIETFRKVFRTVMGEDKEPRFFKVSKSTPDARDYREFCNDVVKEYLNWDYDKAGNLVTRPKSYITENCTKLIESITSLQHPEKNATGRDFDRKIGLQDPFDAYKMGLVAMMPAKPKPPKKEKEWWEVLAEQRAKAAGVPAWRDPFHV